MQTPDDAPSPARAGDAVARPLDLLAARYEFAGYFKRQPTSWRDFRYGMAEIAREDARWKLRHGDAARMAASGKGTDGTDPYERWRAMQQRHAGY